jgi:hypothetical protein
MKGKGGEASMNATTLEQRIAAALTAVDTSSTALADLVTEADAAIERAEQIAAQERKKGLDLVASPDARAAREAVVEAEFTRDRLRTVLPRLEHRLDVQRDHEHRIAWRARYDELKPKRDALAHELEETYPTLANLLADLFSRIHSLNEQIGHLHSDHPAGSGLYLKEVELEARGLDVFTLDERPIAKALQLPAFERGQEALWPPRQKLDLSVLAPTPPYDPRYSADWWKATEKAGTVAAK